MERQLAIYCADIGSVRRGRFGWAHHEVGASTIKSDRGGADILDLVEAVTNDLEKGTPTALGFECPLYVPIPDEALRLGAARAGEGNRPWSAGAGAGALATGLVEMGWVLREVFRRAPDTVAFLDWSAFNDAGHGLFLWEAFVSDRAKTTTHIDDAAVAVAAFWEALPNVATANAVSGEHPLSLLGAALLWSGWSQDIALLRSPCVVIKASPVTDAIETTSDPATGPRANRNNSEIERKLALLDEPHIAPLTAFVRRLHAERGAPDVPWFDPTEAGTEARILLLLENPGRRAAIQTGSGFISADNDDKSAENMWGILREAGIDRRRDIVAANIVPWYLGDESGIGKVRARDLDEARPALLELLSLLPDLRVVILIGRVAANGWRRLRPLSDISVLEAPHPSGRWLNTHPEDRAVIVASIRKARSIAGLS